MQQDQKGFSGVHALLIIVILLLIFITGFLIYHEQQDAERRSQTQQQVSGLQNKVVEDSTEVSDDLNADTPQLSYGDPVARLNDLYTQYISEAGNHRGDSGVKDFQNKGYINPAFSGDTSGEPLLCGQEMVPDKVSVALISKKDKLAILQVKKIYNDGSLASSVINAEMSPNSANIWALSKVTCDNS